MKTTIVTTTIFVPHFLTGYAENIKRFGRKADFVVVADKKTPPEAEEFCRTIPNCRYLGLPEQTAYMSTFPELANHIPYNSAERRNIGILYAFESGADTIITVDDDNLATSHDIVDCHGVVHDSIFVKTYGSSSGWFNVCSVLEEKNGVKFYHRGYPSKQRWNDGFITAQPTQQKVAVNAGLWLDNPDVDAITRLERELVVTGAVPDFRDTIALAPGTWSPFNCQNTALRRDVIPAYFLSPYTGRHADILASFVVNRITEHLDEAIAFGAPFARHKRTPHDLWKDALAEREGQSIADEFCEKLRSIKLTGTTYHRCFGEIVEALWTMRNYNAMEGMMNTGMRLWHQAFNKLGAQ